MAVTVAAVCLDLRLMPMRGNAMVSTIMFSETGDESHSTVAVFTAWW